MVKKKFKARTGFPFPRKDAQKIGEELESIKAEGVLNPEKVVNRARNRESILHNYFEWNDTKAADEFRLKQAMNIVNNIIEVTIIKGEKVEERAFFSVIVKKDENAYVSLTEALTTPSYRKQLLGEMETTVENLLRLIKLFSSME